MKTAERTIESLLGLEEKIYRITKKQIEELSGILVKEVKNGTRKGVSNVDGSLNHFTKSDTQLQHGAFNGRFEDGVLRREYAKKILKLL